MNDFKRIHIINQKNKQIHRIIKQSSSSFRDWQEKSMKTTLKNGFIISVLHQSIWTKFHWAWKPNPKWKPGKHNWKRKKRKWNTPAELAGSLLQFFLKRKSFCSLLWVLRSFLFFIFFFSKAVVLNLSFNIFEL